MTFLRSLAASLILVPFLALFSAAQDEAPRFPEPKGDTISDFASVLNATEEGRIGRILAETRETTGVQVVVVITPGLAVLNGQGMRLEPLGRALFDDWGIGDDQRNDGILILIDTEAREARITLGAGYDAIYDERAARVLSSALLPKLRDEGMAAGIEAAVISARDQLILPFLKGEPISASDGFPAAEGNLGQRIAIAFAGITGFLGLYLWRRRRARKICPECHKPTLQRSREVITSATKFQDGVGMLHLECSSCGFVDRQSYAIARDSKEAQRDRAERLAALDKAAENQPEDRENGMGGGKSGDGGASGKW